MGNLSVINDMALKFGMEKLDFEETIMNTIIPATEKQKATPSQVASFLLVAKEYDLNPFTKEIYAFPAKGGGVQPIVSVDGWLKIINSHPQFDGMEFVDELIEGKLNAITCKIYRKDRSHPVVVTEYIAECKRNTDPWKTWPARMLRHKATIQAARYAFGFAGIVDPDEAERIIEMGERANEPTVTQPQPKSKTREKSNNTEETEKPDHDSEPQQTAKPANGKTISDGQARVLRKKIETASVDESALCMQFEIGNIEELPMAVINDALKWCDENGHAGS